MPRVVGPRRLALWLPRLVPDEAACYLMADRRLKGPVKGPWAYPGPSHCTPRPQAWLKSQLPPYAHAALIADCSRQPQLLERRTPYLLRTTSYSKDSKLDSR